MTPMNAAGIAKIVGKHTSKSASCTIGLMARTTSMGGAVTTVEVIEA